MLINIKLVFDTVTNAIETLLTELIENYTAILKF